MVSLCKVGVPVMTRGLLPAVSPAMGEWLWITHRSSALGAAAKGSNDAVKFTGALQVPVET